MSLVCENISLNFLGFHENFFQQDVVQTNFNATTRIASTKIGFVMGEMTVMTGVMKIIVCDSELHVHVTIPVIKIIE